MTTIERPLITFAIIAYNQERFVHEAVEGALSQTYSPLEIILSDDCSTDGTFEIMQKMAAEYRGPHKIVLNHNDTNLCIGAHINRIMELSHGELIVGAAGDDISLPHRTAEIYKAWQRSDKKAFSLDSDVELIDEYGNSIVTPKIDRLPQDQQLLIFSKTLISPIIGCTHAWHRKVFDLFGLLPNISLEDQAIPPRSMLLGNVTHIDKVLVEYRVHSNNMSNRKFTEKEAIAREVRDLNDRITIGADVIRCINEYKCTINDYSRVCELDESISNIKTSREKCILKLKFITGYRVIKILHLLKYASLYELQWGDRSWILRNISITAYRLLFHCKKMILKILKIDKQVDKIR
jgi:glycosyltransferase involved in cell wall biosynthesis